MLLGEKIQALRKKKGMSQEQLALQLDVSRQAVSKWELNSSIPDTDKIIQLSDLFNVTTDYLLKDAIVEEKESPILPVDRTKGYTKRFGIACILFSTISFFIVWLLEKIYPAPIVYFNPETQSWKVGLDNFIWVYSLENFMIILGISLVVGIGLLFHKQLKNLYKLTKEKWKRTKRI